MEHLPRTLSDALSGCVLAIACAAVTALPARTQATQAISVEPTPVAVIRGISRGDRVVEEFGRVSGATFDRRDWLMVADASTGRIATFSPWGEQVRAAGRLGTGPGEYAMIEWIGKCTEAELVVFDLSQQRFTVLDESLSYVRSFRLAAAPTELTCAPGGRVAFLEVLRDSQPTGARQWSAVAALVTARLDGTGEVSIGRYRAGDLLRVGPTWMSSPTGRRSSLSATARGISIADGSAAPVIIVDSLGQPLHEVRIRASAVRHDSATVREAAEQFMSRVTNAPLRETLTARLVAAPRTDAEVHYRRAIFDAEGALWLQRSIAGSGYLQVEVLDRSGRVLGSYRQRGDAELAAVGRNTVALLVTQPTGELTVELHRVSRR